MYVLQPQRGIPWKGMVDNTVSSASRVLNQVASFVAWKQIPEVQCTFVDERAVVPGPKNSATNVLARTPKDLNRGDLHVAYHGT